MADQRTDDETVLDPANNVQITLQNATQVFQIMAKELFSQQDTFGTEGSGNEQMDTPSGIAITSDGTEVWVVDTGNHRITRWDREGAWIGAFGAVGSGNEQFDDPIDIAMDATYAYIADRDNNRIQKVQISDRSFTARWTTNYLPTGVTVDTTNSKVLVARRFSPSATAGYITQYDTDGSNAANKVSFTGQYPQCVHWNAADGYFYVTRTNDDSYKPHLYRYTSAWVLQSSALGRLLPSGMLGYSYMASGADGCLYVSRPEWHKVDKRLAFAQTLESLTTYGSEGSGTGRLSTPKGVAVYGDDVFVVDSGNHRVVRIRSLTDSNGTVFQVGNDGTVKCLGLFTQSRIGKVR